MADIDVSTTETGTTMESSGAHTAAVVVRGDLDMDSTSRFLSAVTMALASPRPELVVDLREVTFIDSVGLGALLQARSRAAADGRGFRITSPSTPARRLLEVTGLADLLLSDRS